MTRPQGVPPGTDGCPHPAGREPGKSTHVLTNNFYASYGTTNAASW